MEPREASHEAPIDCSSVSSGSYSLLNELGIIEPDFEFDAFDEQNPDDICMPQTPVDPLNIRTLIQTQSYNKLLMSHSKP